MRPVGKARGGLTGRNDRLWRAPLFWLALACALFLVSVAVRAARTDGARLLFKEAETVADVPPRCGVAESGVVRPRRVLPASSSRTGTVFEVTSSGAIVAGGAVLPPRVVPSEDERALEKAEEEWECVIGAVERPLPRGEMDVVSRKLSRALRRLPGARRAEALQSALNLMPAENLPIMANLALDRTQDAEIVDMAFSSVLGGDDKLKESVLVRIATDRTHPNHTDAARLLDLMRLNGRRTSR